MGMATKKKQPCESFRRKACGHYDEDRGCFIKVAPLPDGWERVAEYDWCKQYGLILVKRGSDGNGSYNHNG